MEISNDSGGRKMKEAEKDIFFNEIKKKHQPNRKVKNAIIWLFVIGGINVLVGSFYYFNSYQNNEDLYLLIEALIVGFVFVGLGFLAATKPYTAFLIAIILYSALIVLGAIGDISTLYKGIIIKVFVYAALIKGLSVAKDDKNNKNEDLIDDIDFFEN